MVIQTDDRIDAIQAARRALILRDSLSFLSLTLATAVLFAITLTLFRSFTVHRSDLGVRWSARGAQALHDGRPADAIMALRTALSYAPGDRNYELLLAQALGQAGRTDESFNYFMGLWATQPGDGFINLQLARLAAQKAAAEPRHEDRSAAVNFYRASLYGTWNGDALQRRPEVRLELARYLISIDELSAAHAELLTAAGNVSDEPSLDITLGDLLEQTGDPDTAWIYYRKALEAAAARHSSAHRSRGNGR